MGAREAGPSTQASPAIAGFGRGASVSLSEFALVKGNVGDLVPNLNPAGIDSYLKARTALTVYQARERQLAIQKKKGTLVDRARAEALVFRLARQERDVWVTWPARVAALMAAQIAAEIEKQSGKSAMIDATTMHRVLDAHVRAQLEALADLRVSLG